MTPADERERERREHLVRLACIGAAIVAGVAYVTAEPDGPASSLVLGALSVLVPALVDALRHWRQLRP